MSSSRHQVAETCREIADALLAAATDPAADLPVPERRALAGLSVALEAEADRIDEGSIAGEPAIRRESG